MALLRRVVLPLFYERHILMTAVKLANKLPSGETTMINTSYVGKLIVHIQFFYSLKTTLPPVS